MRSQADDRMFTKDGLLKAYGKTESKTLLLLCEAITVKGFENIESYIDFIIRKNHESFNQVGFIGTD